MLNQTIIERDLAVLWHPCTQMKDHEHQFPLIPIKRGEGVWLEDFSGKRYLDAISSWWVNLFGHANPRINAALRNQLENLEHVMLAGFTHEAVLELSERLVQLTPPELTRCFYADNGSSCVEVALKMSFHFWQNSGQPQKTKFIALQDSYHGETLGALAVGDVALYKKTYAPLLMPALIAPSPASCYAEMGESPAAFAERQFAQLEQLLQIHNHEVAAIIVEPLVQCAGGMRMYDPIYLKLLRQACDRYQVHLIADEIAVGMGRTGKLFACEHAEITPDFLCLSKGLTGGYLPLSVVITREAVYQAFYDDYTKLTAFLHSHSYTGNALACRAALATLDIFAQDNILDKNQVLISKMSQLLSTLQSHPHIGNIRQQGMIAAMDMFRNSENRETYAWQERRGLAVYRYALQHGVLLRPLGHVVYFMPPYVITPQQIEFMVEVAAAAIDYATKN